MACSCGKEKTLARSLCHKCYQSMYRFQKKERGWFWINRRLWIVKKKRNRTEEEERFIKLQELEKQRALEKNKPNYWDNVWEIVWIRPFYWFYEKLNNFN